MSVNVSQNVQAIRKKLGFSEEQVSTYLGVTRSVLRKYESNTDSIPFDVFDKLDKIQAKTLVIGAALDQVIPVEFSNELAKKINCQKLIFEKSGHAVHQEVSDFNRTVLNFLKSSN